MKASIIKAGTGVITAILLNLFGGLTLPLSSLLLFMGIDIITGYIDAAVFHTSTKTETGALSSAAGIKGIARKFFILIMIVMARRIDMLLTINYVQNSVTVVCIVNELISIIENIGLAGVPIPEPLKSAIDILKKEM